MTKLKEQWARAKGLYDKVSGLLGDKHVPFNIQNIIAAFFTALLAISAVFMKAAPMQYTDLAYVEAINAPVFLLSVVLLTAVLLVAAMLFKAERILPPALVIATTVFCSFLQKGGDRNIYIGIGNAIILYLSCVWIFRRFDKPFSMLKIGKNTAAITVAVMFLVFAVYMSVMSVCRYYSFTYNTFDFGIFAQMFDYMKQTGVPFTTVERGTLLSHFAVHFSPFFYLLMPGYYLFSTPAYLCVMQAVFVGLGVFAVYGIVKHLGFSPKMSVLAGALYLLYPSISYGLYLDFHENKFLTVCILFTVYFMLKRKWIPFYICGLLICTVKEDAAMYLIAIGLYMLFHERLIKHGSITLVMAFAYFAFALFMIRFCGAEEGMQFGYRYSNFELNGEAGVGSLVKITLLDLGYTLHEIFQQEKAEFLLWMFLPVLFTPFTNRKISVLLLLTPMLIINMMSNWLYQYDVDFQYTYGTAALILLCTFLALAKVRAKKRKALLLTAVLLCCTLTVPRVIARNTSYIGGYQNNREMFHEAIAFINETVPTDSVVGVEGDVMPVMYNYPQLYMDPRTDDIAATLEYYVAKNYDSDIKEMTSRGFELVADNGYIHVYKNPFYEPAVQE